MTLRQTQAPAVNTIPVRLPLLLLYYDLSAWFGTLPEHHTVEDEPVECFDELNLLMMITARTRKKRANNSPYC